MHYADCCASFRGNFDHLIIGTELSKLDEFSFIKHTLPLERSRYFHH